MKNVFDNEIGLALGGGAVLGAAHIGVIKALEEFNASITLISGTSIGAFIAALYALGMSIEEIEKVAIELDWLEISELSLSQYGLLSNKKIGNVITENFGNVHFKDTKIPLSVIATDIGKGEKVILNKGSIIDAVMASTCIPGLFIPIEKDDRLLIDGGIVENVPVLSLRDMNASYIIGVDLNAQQSFEKPKNIIEVLINTINLTLMNATKLQTDKADFLITPDLKEFNVFDTKQVPDLIQKGYKEAKEQIQSMLNS